MDVWMSPSLVRGAAYWCRRIITKAVCCTQRKLEPIISCMPHMLIVNLKFFFLVSVGPAAQHGGLRAGSWRWTCVLHAGRVFLLIWSETPMLMLGWWPSTALNNPPRNSCSPHVSGWKRWQTFLWRQASLCHFGAAGLPLARNWTKTKLDSERDNTLYPLAHFREVVLLASLSNLQLGAVGLNFLSVFRGKSSLSGPSKSTCRAHKRYFSVTLQSFHAEEFFTWLPFVILSSWFTALAGRVAYLMAGGGEGGDEKWWVVYWGVFFFPWRVYYCSY